MNRVLEKILVPKAKRQKVSKPDEKIKESDPLQRIEEGMGHIIKDLERVDRHEENIREILQSQTHLLNRLNEIENRHSTQSSIMPMLAMPAPVQQSPHRQAWIADIAKEKDTQASPEYRETREKEEEKEEEEGEDVLVSALENLGFGEEESEVVTANQYEKYEVLDKSSKDKIRILGHLDEVIPTYITENWYYDEFGLHYGMEDLPSILRDNLQPKDYADATMTQLGKTCEDAIYKGRLQVAQLSIKELNSKFVSGASLLQGGEDFRKKNTDKLLDKIGELEEENVALKNNNEWLEKEIQKARITASLTSNNTKTDDGPRVYEVKEIPKTDLPLSMKEHFEKLIPIIEEGGKTGKHGIKGSSLGQFVRNHCIANSISIASGPEGDNFRLLTEALVNYFKNKSDYPNIIEDGDIPVKELESPKEQTAIL